MTPEFSVELQDRFPARRKYLVGVSGGRDSVALLHLLHGAGYSKLVVCHLNHGLRGRDSGQDSAFVRRLSKRLGYPVEVSRQPVDAIARRERLSLETAARQCRYEFFAAVARRHRCGRIFLAHHADDQAETVLMNLCRGAGLRGMSGMKEESEHRVGKTIVKVLRPLLGIRRAEIEAYVARQKIPFREDSSNAEIGEFTRNRIRREVIPLLDEVFQRDVAVSIQRLSEIARSELESQDWWLGNHWKELTNGDGDLRVARMRELPPGLRRLVIAEWLRRKNAPGCGFSEIEIVASLIPPGAGPAKINLPGGWFARRNRGRIFLER
jgi:tRNA(Ile)-lysidine synthase